MASEFILDPEDIDPIETQEWVDALKSVLECEGSQRAQFILNQVQKYAAEMGVSVTATGVTTPYLNTIPENAEVKMPDDGTLLERLTNIMRWNAIAMVMRGGKVSSELGGHIASYGSIATLFEVGFQHFFHAKTNDHGGDLVFFQGHSSPGIYARAYLEGRLSEEQIANFRQEIFKGGVSSYPHPWLMPHFWQLPTVSMGLGPLMAIYQARFLKYLGSRGLANTESRKVWAFCGDGEMGEPESQGALYLAGRERLDNLIFVINCNLQRLDGPVWGNGQIIQEFEGIFRGARWNVIKVIWGHDWCQLLEKDKSGLLHQRMSELIDGEYQAFTAKGGAYLREHFFGKYPELLALVADKSDDELSALHDGGHDPQKVYAAYARAVKQTGQPSVLLIKTIKGYGMGKSGRALNVTHQTKKLPVEELMHFRERFKLPLSEQDIEKLQFYKPAANTPEMQYLYERRKALGGYLPSRHPQIEKIIAPPLSAFSAQLEGSGDREISSTMAFVRILNALLKDEHFGHQIVPILADESRTFGMEGLFRQIGIYSPFGQQYHPEDKKQLMYYREDVTGQLLQEGISEAGAMASWIAAATSYANSHVTMIPFYIYYSMFGFQRFGDLAWAAGDMRARGFILGGTAGRTTLAGEGLQHQDGHNLLMFSMVPNCVSYDPTFAYEVAVIIQDGLRRMYQEQEDVYYYITLMNENYAHPAMPKDVEQDILAGMYLFQESKMEGDRRVQLMGSGTILREVIKAAEILERDYEVAVNVWSVTSFNELRKDMESVTRFNRLHPDEPQRESHVTKCFKGRTGIAVAATDYMKLFADQIRADIPLNYTVLGTDGYGRSDLRAALRDFFEVDAKMVVYTTLRALANQGQFDRMRLMEVMQQLGIDPNRQDPVKC